MGNDSFILRRTIILCAFLLCGCSQQSQTLNDNDEKAKHSQPSSHNDGYIIDDASTPLLSLHELLNANDVKLALSQAAKDDDIESLLLWQETLLEAADEVNLSAKDRALISGEQGLKYLTFQGVKVNYQIAFEKAFLEFADVDAVYKAYPAFVDLHKRSIALVKQRDQLIAKVVEELETNDYQGDALAEARRQWQNFFIAESAKQDNPTLL